MEPGTFMIFIALVHPKTYSMCSFLMILIYCQTLAKMLFLCSKKAVKDVTDEDKICILDVDRQVSELQF